MKKNEEKKWVSGIIKAVNEEGTAGIISQVDGVDVLFNFDDFLNIKGKKQTLKIEKGKEVLYNLEMHPLFGLKATNIIPLDMPDNIIKGS